MKMPTMSESVAQVATNIPLLCGGDGQQFVADMMRMEATDRSDGEAMAEELKETLAFNYFGRSTMSGKAFAFVDGNAIIPVHGSLINRFGGAWGFVTGYNYIRKMVTMAEIDPEVQNIILDVNSGGGMVQGCEETGEIIKRAAKNKSVIAVVDANSHSAAYWLSSSASKIVLTPTGNVGSIGALAIHRSYARAMAENGVDITVVRSAKHKAETNPYEELTDEAKKAMQAEVDKIGDTFSQQVAENRNLDKSTVKEWQAKTFDAEQALAVGLVDAVALPAEALNILAARNDSGLNEANEMKPEGTAENANNAAPTAEALANAAKEGATAERTRISGILMHAEADGRTKLAQHLAFNTEMNVEGAAGILAMSAKEVVEDKAAANADPAKLAEVFDGAMDATGNPGIKAGIEEPGAEKKAQGATIDDFAKSYAAVFGAETN